MFCDFWCFADLVGRVGVVCGGFACLAVFELRLWLALWVIVIIFRSVFEAVCFAFLVWFVILYLLVLF